jgi:hypothetical protein
MKELPFQEIEALLESVISNKRLEKIEYSDGVEFVIFSYPKAQDLICSRYMRDKAMIEAQQEGLPTLEEAEALVEKATPQEDKDKLKDLEEKIKAQEAVFEVTAIEARRSTVQENIERLKEEVEGLKRRSQNLLYMSQERKADEESFLYLAWASAYAVTGERFWKTFEDFEKEVRQEFRLSFIEKFSKFNIGLTSKEIRFLSRHSLWRIRYTAASKTGQQLFDNGLVDLTPDQLSLLYWSNYYQSIFEMMPDDMPSPEIIEDDDKLDKYMDSYFKNREEDRTEKKAADRGKTGRRSKLSAWDKGEELIITPSHPDYMKLAYTKERVKAAEGTSEVEVIAPSSRRARNRRAGAKSQAYKREGIR